MPFYSTPRSDYHNIYDRAKFTLVWNMSVGFIVLMSIVSISNFSNPNYTAVPNFIAIGMGLAALVWLKLTKKYKIVCYFITITSFLLIAGVYYYFDNIVQYTTPMWVILNVLFAFFTLGNRWGFALLFAQFVIIVLYGIFKMESNLANVAPYTVIDKVNFAIEFLITGVGIGYILYLFIVTTRKVESKYVRSNNQLEKKNSIITTQNSEKEVMLKEIHHRVKNNLQVISSLLRLQSNSLQVPEAEKEFDAAISRVKTMAIIHEIIYQGDNLSNVQIDVYLKRLCNELLSSYSTLGNVDFQLDADSSMFNTKTTVPLALLINELISNSLEHAFLEQENPQIKVNLKMVEEDYFFLEYSDNGCWKGDSDTTTFGLELIQIMTEQLNGTMQLDKTEKGTYYKFSLQMLSESQRTV